MNNRKKRQNNSLIHMGGDVDSLVASLFFPILLQHKKRGHWRERESTRVVVVMSQR